MEVVKLETIEDLVNEIKIGNIDPERLNIVLDNDDTSFYYEKDEEIEFEIEETNGYLDILPLYKLLFPKSRVEWC